MFKKSVTAVKNWVAEKQPDFYVKAIRRTIADLPGGYEEAPTWLGSKVTKDSLFNRLRTNGDQIFPLGWALVLQKACGKYYVTEAIARASGGVFIPLPDIEEVDNADINQRLLESIEEIGIYSQKVRAATEDGVIDSREREEIDEEFYRVITRLEEHKALLYMIHCRSKEGDARECAAPGTVASYGMEKTNA
ncbi:hypothetical protein DOE59_16580 [Salmonella enterica subsp. diarizonae serovar 48:i:z]|uniref:DNA-binding protein n=1 Tax=Salmonella enterica subsp. diarizonae serovar 48:i:z TaxID=1192842 RepID=A0A7U5YL65_SALDZ|nr:YmfL family putative regulatory protein [Salmonella enterica]AXC74979.1 hypothetical protein DOE59_16580 [Salmonella enterica subsp. diarizonae serovar 48:i:z]